MRQMVHDMAPPEADTLAAIVQAMQALVVQK